MVQGAQRGGGVGGHVQGQRLGAFGTRVWRWALLKTGPDPVPGARRCPGTSSRHLLLRGAQPLPCPCAPGAPSSQERGAPGSVPADRVAGAGAVIGFSKGAARQAEAFPFLERWQRGRAWWSRSMKATKVPEAALGGSGIQGR